MTARGNTPLRSIRIPDEVWAAAKARAESEGTTVSAVIMRSLKRYAKQAARPGGTIQSSGGRPPAHN